MTSGIAWAEVREAMVAAITADQGIMALITGIFDDPPEDAEYPFIELGDPDAQPDDTHDTRGMEMQDVWHFWSTDNNRASAMTLMKMVDAVLAHQKLALSGTHYTVDIVLDRQTVIRESDDMEPAVRIVHGIQYWRIHTAST